MCERNHMFCHLLFSKMFFGKSWNKTRAIFYNLIYGGKMEGGFEN